MSLISVIVPVYKVENYLQKCVESILNQTYKNLEVILIDDGSPDRCPEICDEFAKKDSRIKVIHKHNGGISDVRNIGIEQARGEFILFVDSDDFIHPEMIAILYKNLIDTGANISMCDFQVVGKHDKCTFEFENDITIVSKKEAINNCFNEMATINALACNKLIKLSLFNNVRYPVGKVHEDESTNFKLLYLCDKIVYSNAKLYFYFQREDSITGVRSEKRTFNKIESVEEYALFFLDKKEFQFADIAIHRYLIFIIERYLESKKLYENETAQKIYELYQLKHKIYIRKLSYSWITKLKFTLFNLSPFVFYLINAFRRAMLKLYKSFKK